MGYDEFDRQCGRGEEIIAEEAFEIPAKGCCSEIKKDIIIKGFKTVRIWGRVMDCQGCSVPRALLKLLYCGGKKPVIVETTISDCQGFYQFETSGKPGTYKIIVARPDEKKPLCNVYQCTKNCNSCDESYGGSCSENYDENCPKSQQPFKNSNLCRTCEFFDENSGSCCLGSSQYGRICPQ